MTAEGFDPYIAVEQQTLRGVRDNIFDRLRDAEYYLFIDFKREQIGGISTPEYRGSLFTHQELALASYLEKDVIAFQEDGVKRLDGLITFLQANCRPFSKRVDLPNLVLDEVRKRGWSPTAFNGLRLELPDPGFTDIGIASLPGIPQGRFFHIKVLNGHPSRTALDCYGYLRRIVNLTSGLPEKFEIAEIKWTGYVFPNAIIPPGMPRLLDAFFVLHGEPLNPQFGIFTDSDRFRPRFRGPVKWALTYEVVSSTVAGTSRTFYLGLENDLGRVQLTYERT